MTYLIVDGTKHTTLIVTNKRGLSFSIKSKSYIDALKLARYFKERGLYE